MENWIMTTQQKEVTEKGPDFAYNTESRRAALAAQTFALQTKDELLALVELQAQRITELTARIEKLEQRDKQEKEAA
jgi:hypothetical protein